MRMKNLLFAHNFMALNANLKFSIFGTKRSISSVTRQPFKLLTHFGSRFFKSISSLRSYKKKQKITMYDIVDKFSNSS